jgi:hypothetical protein
MKCEEARLRLGSEPDAGSPELDTHLGTCPDCCRYRQEMRELERHINRALQLPVPARRPTEGGQVADFAAAAERAAAREAGAAPPKSRTARGWALAASVLLAVMLGVFVAGGRDGDALAADVVAHMAGETESWSAARPVAQSALDLALRRTGVRLERAALGDVVYAHACFFRGRWVPHLVVRTAQGPVTVMVLTGDTVDAAERFDEGGYSGVIAPVPGGAVAVLGRSRLDFDEPLRRVRAALDGSTAPARSP